MNAVAHGADTLYLPTSNPVSEMTALRGAGLIGSALDEERAKRRRGDLALGAILCGYAIDSAGLGLHHLICQTLVRICGTPHAGTNAAILPQAVGFLAERAPGAYDGLAASLGADLPGLPRRIEELGQPQPLSTLGGEEASLDKALDAMLKRPELQRVPGVITRSDLAGIVRSAW
jgi:alcohol dehydrogenase class IV